MSSPVEFLDMVSQQAHDRAARLVSPQKQESVSSPLGMATSDQLFGSNTGTNLRQTAEQYRHHRGRVASAIRVPTNRIAGQPLRVARVLSTGSGQRSLKSWMDRGVISSDSLPVWMKEHDPDKLEILDEHPLLTAVNDPNDLQVRHSLFGMMVMSWLITGRGFWLFTPNEERESGWEITAVPTTWMTPADDGKRIFGKWLVKPPGTMGDPVPFPAELVAHFYYPDPADPRRALSLLQLQANAILADESIRTAQRIGFENGLFPDFAVIAGDMAGEMVGAENAQATLNADDRRKFISWAKREMQGVRKFHVPLVLDRIIKDIKKLSHTPEEMAFLESSNSTKDEIFQGIGVNPISAGQVEGSNRASSAIADEHLLSNVCNPIIEMMSQVLTRTAGPLFASENERLKVWVEKAKPHDPELEMREWEKFGDRATDNEIRQKRLGLPPRNDGDVIRIPINAILQPVDVKQTGRELYHHAMARGQNTLYSGVKGDRTESVVKQWKQVHGVTEQRFAQTVRNFLDLQARDAAKNLRRMQRSAGDDLAFNAFNPRAWDERLTKAVRQDMISAMAMGAINEQNLLKESDISEFRIDLPDAVLAALLDELDTILEQQFWKDINDESLRLMGRQIQQSLEAGENLRQTANRLVDNMRQIDVTRGLRIARTETTSGLNAGQYAVQREAMRDGIIEGGEWLAITDNVVRDTHEALNGAFVGPGEDFNVGGTLVPYPGHYLLPVEERANCRCVRIASVNEVPMAASTAASHNRLIEYCSAHGNGRA